MAASHYCRDHQRRIGAAVIPRTCAHCGLGPCPFIAPKEPAMPLPEDTFTAPPVPTAAEGLPTSLPASVPVPGHGARPDVPPAQARLARLEAACDRFLEECRAIGGRDARIAITNAEQAMLWARRALKVT
jgi:hypothetical protein